MSLVRDDRLRFGVCWYPDHWDRSTWERDLQLMREAGFDLVRIGESSWSMFEPAEGQYDWAFLDEVLGCCADAGFGVVLGTPTYAPPAWLEEAYPEAIAKREDGSPWHRHSRRMYDLTDPDYRRCCTALVEAMAARYATDDRVWAWQVDNEMWCHLEELWGDGVRRAFQVWLESHYESIDNLNHAWGMAFWSNQLTSFEQADLPGPTPANRNHHQWADYRRFLSDTAIGFLSDQRDAIQAVNPQAVVMHNCPFGPIDRAELLGRMDAYGHDHYPPFGDEEGGRPGFGLNFGRFRAYAKRLWVVEQQASQVGNAVLRLPTAAVGEIQASTMQSVGHGANLICYFRWRAFPRAQETEWGGLLPHWGKPGRHYEEVKDLVATLRPHAEVIAQTKPLVTVARLLSYEQSLAHRVEPWLEEYVGSPEIGRHHLRALELNEDQIRCADLKPGDGYQVALMPHAVGVSEDDVYALDKWVAAGGVLVVGPLAGWRDEQLAAPIDEEPPGPLRALTRTRNAETTTWPTPLTIHCSTGSGKVEAGRYGEILEPLDKDVEVLAWYETDWLTGSAAITRRCYGRGQVIHSGVPLCGRVLEMLWVEGPLPKPEQALLSHDPHAEVLTRVSDDYTLHVAINHGHGPAVIHLYRPVCDLLSGDAVTNSFTLNPFSWRIFKEYTGE